MAMTRGGDTVLVKFLCIEQGTAQTPFHSRLWGFQKIYDHVSDMYLIRYRCISCEHMHMVSPSKIHHDTSEGAERKKG